MASEIQSQIEDSKQLLLSLLNRLRWIYKDQYTCSIGIASISNSLGKTSIARNAAAVVIRA